MPSFKADDTIEIPLHDQSLHPDKTRCSIVSGIAHVCATNQSLFVKGDEPAYLLLHMASLVRTKLANNRLRAINVILGLPTVVSIAFIVADPTIQGPGRIT